MGDIYQEGQPTKTDAEAYDNQAPECEIFISDSPVTKHEDDKFGRWPFAKRIANIISARKDPNSIVIGIYGSWGEGKTTVLNFIEQELESDKKTIFFRFNPWLFNDEAKLLQTFFETLAECLGKSTSKNKEKLGELITKYSKILVPIQFMLGPGVSVSLGEVAGNVGNLLSSVTLEEHKKRIEDLLKSEKERIVIMMDDIDRLDKEEIQAIFKLVKLSADFPFTTYILAFDEDMVAEALGEKYGSGSKEAGKRFIEKIIQVPLHLPRADEMSLRQFCLQNIESALVETNIEITENQRSEFHNQFIDGLEFVLKTPRMAIRYRNALTFSLPLLKGEVNIVDLLLIEGVRVFCPKLYMGIRDNQEDFLGTNISINSDNQSAIEKTKSLADSLINDFSLKEQDALKRLLMILFPKLKSVYLKYSFEYSNEEDWAREQRISSSDYFNKYFSYSIPLSEIPDTRIKSFLSQIGDISVDDISAQLKKLMTKESSGKFIMKLRRANEMSGGKAKSLAIGLSRNGNLLSDIETFWGINDIHYAAALINDLLKKIPKSAERYKAATDIVSGSNPINFAIECFLRMRSKDNQLDEDKNFSENEELDLGKIVADRVQKLAQENKEPLFKRFPRHFKTLMDVWTYWGSKDLARDYLISLINDNPKNTLEILKSYLPTAWGYEPGLFSRGSFGRNQYDLLTELVDGKLIFDSLTQIYGDSLNSPIFDGSPDRSLDERVAHQFSYIYKQVISENPSFSDD